MIGIVELIIAFVIALLAFALIWNGGKYILKRIFRPSTGPHRSIITLRGIIITVALVALILSFEAGRSWELYFWIALAILLVVSLWWKQIEGVFHKLKISIETWWLLHTPAHPTPTAGTGGTTTGTADSTSGTGDPASTGSGTTV